MIDGKYLELLQFDKITGLVRERCFSRQAREMTNYIHPNPDFQVTLTALKQTNTLKDILAAGAFFPTVEHEEVGQELKVLAREGSLLNETDLFKLARTIDVTN